MKTEKNREVKNRIIRDSRTIKIISMVRILFVFCGLFWIVMNFILKPVVVTGSSMYPVLENDEIIITDQISYTFSEPKRFDIVVVYSPEEEKNVLKRIIGLPNETVQYRGDSLYIDGNPVYEYFIDEEYKTEAMEDSNLNFTEDYGPVKLKDGEYFVCGDNRVVSKDSRHFGVVKEEDIIARYLFSLDWLN